MKKSWEGACGLQEYLENFGSPFACEIELRHRLSSEWTLVVKWLGNLDLLRLAGIQSDCSRCPAEEIAPDYHSKTTNPV